MICVGFCICFGGCGGGGSIIMENYFFNSGGFCGKYEFVLGVLGKIIYSVGNN